MGFRNFNIDEKILQALDEMGFQNPTPIQEMTIPKLLGDNKQDLVGLASTGTGKTAAFGIPALHAVDEDLSEVQVLILSPTRELAQQVGKEISALAKYTKKKIVVINGGASYIKQKSDLRRGAHICVATPGRLMDLMDQGVLKLGSVHTVILDEADEMISMGFREHIENILENVSERQTWLFSATMNPQIQKVSQKFLKDPVRVQLNQEQGLSPLIESYYFLVKDSNKVAALQRLLLKHPEFYGLIFCQTKAEVAEVENQLRLRGILIESLHGDKKQREREIVLQKLKSKQISAVVATDVAARGLDIKELTHVVNYNLPWEAETFVHRSGRTGRNGMTGVTWSLIGANQVGQLRSLQKKHKFVWQKGSIPSLKDIVLGRIHATLPSMLTHFQTENFQSRMKDFFQKFASSEVGENLKNLDQQQLISLLLWQMYPEISERDLPLEYEERPAAFQRSSERSSNRDFARRRIRRGSEERGGDGGDRRRDDRSRDDRGREGRSRDDYDRGSRDDRRSGGSRGASAGGGSSSFRSKDRRERAPSLNYRRKDGHSASNTR